MYLKNLKKFFIATVASMLAFTLIGVKENKVVNAASMTYAFATGEEALQYAPTISAPFSYTYLIVYLLIFPHPYCTTRIFLSTISSPTILVYQKKIILTIIIR